MSSIILKIKRRETPFWSYVYRFAKAVRSMSLPSVKLIHLPLYYLHIGIKNFTNKMIQGLWIVPAFKARCRRCGSGLRLPNGMPEIIGNHLELHIGQDVQILDATLSAGHVFDTSTIIIGHRVTVGYHTDISAAKYVSVGSDTVIARDCYIADNDGHPTSASRRRKHEGVNENEVKETTIGENCWIGTGVYILKGAKIGSNSIVAANSVVLEGVYPENSIIAGSPAKVVGCVED